MPPKQKEAKKGPAYKAPVPLKDIVPGEVKEPPRDPKPLKVPESFPQAPKNVEPLSPLFQQWPAEETVKSHDFGINSEAIFTDSFHDNIISYLSQQKIQVWKPMNDLDVIQVEEEAEEQQAIKSESKNQIVSFKSIDKENSGELGELCVIETFMRPETEEEMQSRLKEEAEKAEKAAKDKKKAPKKEQPKEEGPLQVSDVKMEDISTKDFMVKSAIWIGSQLQIIKERNLVDVNNNQPVWKKIYPQQNGVPQLTKSGKYWVKLLYMGKYIKIEVDDRVPVDQYMRSMFPLSEKFNEKWTVILTKALIKYLAKASKDNIIGDGLVMYALTGLLSENIPLWHYKEWQKLQEFMSNEHYERKDIIVSCFSSETKSYKKVVRVRVEPQAINEGNEEQAFIEKEVNTKVLNGYAYCVGDYFDNGTFNMVFSQEKTQKEMLLKHEYNQMCKISISNKSREEKLEYRRRKKELKQKLGIEEKKRLELINKPPTHYHFLKLLSNLKMNCEYGDKEILLAKKCVINRLSQPPNYDIPMEKEDRDTKSQTNVSVSLIKYKEESELFPNIHDFSAINNLTELLQRKEDGVWITDTELLQFFDSLQVLYNPNIFNRKLIETTVATKSNCFTSDESKEILVVEKVDQEEQKERRVRLLFGFGYQESPHDSFRPYTILQKFDFDSFRCTSNVVTLDKSILSTMITLKNQNTVFKLNTMSKGNYTYWISSDSPFKMQSISDYLCQYEGYNKKNITFEYPPIEGGSYYPLTRIKLTQTGEEPNTILVKAINTKDELLRCLSYRLVALPKNESPMTSQQTEGIIKRTQQKTLLAYQYSRFIIEPELEYYLIVEVNSVENIPDGSLELLLLSKSQGFSAENLEQVQPIKVIEKYIPNKYGLICKQRLFTNSDCNTTISVKLAEFQEVQGGGGGRKGAKKGGKDQPATELIEKSFTHQRHIIVMILKNEEILFQATGVNEITIPNFKFLSTKTNPEKQYYLQSKFDLRLWPESAIKSEDTQKICWVTQISSTDSVALVRDTKQEDKEKQIRKSWEDSQSGRAERAKKARKRFLIEMKKENGEQLTEEEEQILNAPRLTKKQLLQEEKKNEENKKGAKGGKKDDKKGGKDAKKEEVPEEKLVQREPPISKDNFMNEIKEFLKILQNCVVRYEVLDQDEARIRSPEQIRSIKEAAIMASENRIGKLIRNIERRETLKIRQKEKKETISIFFTEVKSQLKQKYDKYVEWRSTDMQKDKAKQEKERFLIDVISQEKPTISQPDLKKNIQEYRLIADHNAYLADVADMVRKNIRIANLSEKITTLMAGWEIDELKNINEQIKSDRIEGIEEEIMKQFRQMLEEVEKNPNIVAEKQAEAKKAKKGGKK